MYGHSLLLPSQLQLHPRAPQAAPEKVDIPSTIRLAKEKKERDVDIQEASHVYVQEGVVIGPHWMPRTTVHTVCW